MYLQGRKIVVHNGQNTLFWKDIWLYDKPLYVLFPDLFKFCKQQNVIVDQVRSNPMMVSFNRWLVDDMLIIWQKILEDMNKFQFSNEIVTVSWIFGQMGRFTVKSVYNALTINDAGPYYKKVWKGRIPSKIKIFLWLLLNNAILTKYNLLKRNWIGSPDCFFCNCEENVSHLFFHCSTAKAVWAIVAHCFGVDDIPKSLNQCWPWCEQWLPHGKQFIPWALRLSAGQFGKLETKLVLKGSSLRVLLRLYAIFVPY
jgi:hypothetical protein